MMSKGTGHFADLASEAAYRLAIAIRMLDDQRDSRPDESDVEDMGGYDYCVAREILEDVMKALREASTVKDKGGSGE